MADYYSILNKTVSGLPNNNEQTRNLVYAKARTAIDKQLRAISPTPGEEVIARQMASLEEAIEKIEAENAAPEAAAVSASPPPPVRPPPAATTPLPPTPPSSPYPGDFSAASERLQPQPGLAAPPPPAASRTAPQAAPAPQAYDASLDSLQDTDHPVTVRHSRDTRLAGDYDEGRKRSALVPILVTLVVLALVGAGGYGLWINKEPLMAALGIGGGTDEAEVTDDAGDGTAPEADQPVEENGSAQKEETRLGSDGSTVVPEARDVTADARDPSTSGAPATSTENAGGPTVAEQPADAPRSSAGPADEQQVNPVDDGSGNQQADNSVIPGAPSTQLGQKAFLYEEGVANAQASRDDGEMVWTLEQESPAEGQPPEAVIKGRLDIPSRGLTMDVLIRRNTDESLSASHLIELVFKAPSDFSGGNIDTIARFVMKPSEQARGEPLIAVPVKISPGYFMIALNNLDQARQANEKLMVEADWIDIPLSYATGRRALVTLSKGETGSEVFNEAFESWKNR